MSVGKLLNVDDYAPGRHARTTVLRRAGFDVTEASTGQEALRLAEQEQPQLVVLDVNLPDMSGIEVCRRIKSDSATSGIIVMHLTASFTKPGDQVIGLENGADTYLTEPVEPRVLIATIHALLRARRAEEALRKSNEELRHFTYMISHELNEPLRTVTSFSELLAKKYAGQLDAEANHYISEAVAGAKRMESFVRDVLTFSQAAASERKFSVISSEAALTSALFALKTQIRDAGAEVTYDPLPFVMGDEMRLAVVFTNLIGNALKYRGETPPRIHVSAVRDDTQWIIGVRDNGIGIAPEYHERIFGVFRRLHGREFPGSGIGLAICKRVIENHGGRIWVESQSGHGSIFYFTLPAVPADDSPGTVVH